MADVKAAKAALEFAKRIAGEASRLSAPRRSPKEPNRPGSIPSSPSARGVQQGPRAKLTTKPPVSGAGNVPRLSLRESLTNGERPRFEETESLASDPIPKEVSEGALAAHIGRVHVLLLTATATERDAVLRVMQRSPAIIGGTIDGRRYVVGRVGRHLVALTKSRAGSSTRDGSLLAVRRAIDTWKPRAVIAVGIAFGGVTEKQRIADVLVSTRLFHYEIVREQKPARIERGAVPESGKVLLEQFSDVQGWSFLRPDGHLSAVRDGPLLTGEKLVDSLDFKEELFKRFPEAIGGEMEGSGIYAACADVHHNEWIVVKAICDWADGTKEKGYQKLAASAAASLVEYVLCRKDALAAIPQLMRSARAKSH